MCVETHVPQNELDMPCVIRATKVDNYGEGRRGDLFTATTLRGEDREETVVVCMSYHKAIPIPKKGECHDHTIKLMHPSRWRKHPWHWLILTTVGYARSNGCEYAVCVPQYVETMGEQNSGPNH